MANTSKIAVAAAFGVCALAALSLKSAYDDERDYGRFIDDVSRADVTPLICASENVPPDLVRTLAPVLHIEDSMTKKTAKEFLRAALDQGLRFALCPLAEATTSYEIIETEQGREQAVIKINTNATSQQQQAAVLQFLKEHAFNSVAPGHNNLITSDPALAGKMPGRMPATMPAKLQYGVSPLPLNIPVR